MRAQISLELFFGFAMFLLMLVWLNSYLSLANTDLNALASQKRLIASQVVILANNACSSGQTIYYDVPCLIEKGSGFNSTYEYLETTLEFGTRVTTPGPTFNNLVAGNEAKVSELLYKPVAIQSACDFVPAVMELGCKPAPPVPPATPIPFTIEEVDRFRKICFTPSQSNPNLIEVFTAGDCPS